MNAHDILVRADALLDGSERWTKDTYARDAEGCRVEWDHPEAAKFCALGALQRASFVLPDGRLDFAPPRCEASHAAERALSDAARGLYGASVAAVNDARGFEAVKRVYAEAIARTRPTSSGVAGD